MATKLSAHFTREELACPCCDVCNVDAKLLIALEELRALVGKPLSINSGYRCEKQNKKDGGGQSSQHLLGRAVDVSCPQYMSLKEFYEAALKVKAFNGIGAYPAGRGQRTNFLHLDIRPAKARWSRIDGKYLAIEEAFKDA
jgi:uncharacterized protein YcbK (DUF882 family)